MRRMSFSDSVEKGKKGTAGGKKKGKELIMSGLGRSITHSTVAIKTSTRCHMYVKKESRGLALLKHSPTRQMSVYPLLMLICF